MAGMAAICAAMVGSMARLLDCAAQRTGNRERYVDARKRWRRRFMDCVLDFTGWPKSGCLVSIAIPRWVMEWSVLAVSLLVLLSGLWSACCSFLLRGAVDSVRGWRHVLKR